MPLRNKIGVSLALMVMSAGALAKAAYEHASYYPVASANTEPKKSANRSGKCRILQRAAHPRSLSTHAARRHWRSRRPDTVAQYADDNPSRDATDPTRAPQIGQASWYDLVGARTSSGERLDTSTFTAAHRSLPLGSRAKVTDLDTGRSVIVRINDRGPYNRRFIIDLSPRAADELGMRHAGVAAVAVEAVSFVSATVGEPQPIGTAYLVAGAGLGK
jgi:rare lipoprotein A (peptidoglycan hydrolase)